jgi:hypothetical protein
MDALHAVDDNPVACIESLKDDALATEFGAQVHLAITYFVIGCDDKDEFLALVEADSAIGNEQKVLLMTAGEPDRDEHAWQQRLVLVVKLGPSADGSRVNVDPIIEGLDEPLVDAPGVTLHA